MATGNLPGREFRRMLGLGFGLAMAFGGTIGVGILRLPGTVAASLGAPWLIVSFWILGGLYALLGAVTVSELAAMLPQAGGFYVYARRAFGKGAGFVVGWSDWFNNVASIAYACITASAFLGALWPAASAQSRVVSLVILAAFTSLQWVGMHMGRALTNVISALAGLVLLTLVAVCFTSTRVPAVAVAPLANSVASLPFMSVAMIGALVTALRAVLVTYDGWYAPIYFAEENVNPAATLPRALIGGTVLVSGLYVIVNIAFLRVLPLPALAASRMPAADAARAVLSSGGVALVTAISFVTLLSLINATLLMAPRILVAIGRDGLFTAKAALVSAGGTPRVALACTSVASGVLILSGTFEQIISLASVLFLLNYLSAYASMFALRFRDPAASRPYRAFGFPVSSAVVFIGSILFFVGAITDDPRSALIAGLLLLASVAVYFVVRTRRKLTKYHGRL
jgi:basic amino acid/polyamine antiporter, APA family